MNSNYYKLQAIESNLKSEYSLKQYKSLIPHNLEGKMKEYKEEVYTIQKENKGFNGYAGIFGIALYHTFNIYQRRVLVNEMGKGAVVYVGICLAVGLATGLFFGNTIGKDVRVRRTAARVKRMLESADKTK
jgi:hypothetical protein